MTYNIHPIVVHFPVALLTLYSLIVLIPVVYIAPRVHWHEIKRVLLLLGTLGAYVAFITGDMAEEIVGENLITEKHAFFAGFLVVVFLLALIREVVLFIRERKIEKNVSISPLLGSISGFIESHWVEKVFALVGIVVLLVTGALGGAMVYGTSADPLTAPILKILGIS